MYDKSGSRYFAGETIRKEQNKLNLGKYMSVNPQYTYDNKGNPVGVFLTISDWFQITEELNLEIPEWQKKLIDIRLQEYQSNPLQMKEADEFFAELDREDLKNRCSA